MSEHHGLRRAVRVPLLACLTADGPGDRARVEHPSEPLAMTRALACESIKGYQDYVPRPEAALTEDEKFLVYYEPLNYTIERCKSGVPGPSVSGRSNSQARRKAYLME